MRDPHQSGATSQRGAEPVAFTFHRLPDMNAHANADRAELARSDVSQPLLRRSCGRYCAGGVGEHCGEAVAGVLEHRPAGIGHRPHENTIIPFERRTDGRGMRGPQRRRADDIGEQKNRQRHDANVSPSACRLSLQVPIAHRAWSRPSPPSGTQQRGNPTPWR